jgi:hypothetical protein
MARDLGVEHLCLWRHHPLQLIIDKQENAKNRLVLVCKMWWGSTVSALNRIFLLQKRLKGVYESYTFDEKWGKRKLK